MYIHSSSKVNHTSIEPDRKLIVYGTPYRKIRRGFSFQEGELGHNLTYVMYTNAALVSCALPSVTTHPQTKMTE